MSTEVALHQPKGALAIREDQTDWTPQQKAALAQLGVQDAPEGDLAVFLNQAQRTGLDPFLRQIYMIGRWAQGGTKYTIQTGIDGLRIVAQRTGEYAGQTEPEWCGEDGVWKTIWVKRWGTPAAARVGVYRKGFAAPLYGVAMFDEYAQTTKNGDLTKMWAEKGVLMIAKCAEALALRKAFPQDLSGLYTAEEMSQADTPSFAPVQSTQRAVPAEPETITEAQTKKLHAVKKGIFAGDEEYRSYLSYGYGVASSKDLTYKQAEDFINDLASVQKGKNDGVERRTAVKMFVLAYGGPEYKELAQEAWKSAGFGGDNPAYEAFIHELNVILAPDTVEDAADAVVITAEDYEAEGMTPPATETAEENPF